MTVNELLVVIAPWIVVAIFDITEIKMNRRRARRTAIQQERLANGRKLPVLQGLRDDALVVDRDHGSRVLVRGQPAEESEAA